MREGRREGRIERVSCIMSDGVLVCYLSSGEAGEE